MYVYSAKAIPERNCGITMKRIVFFVDCYHWGVIDDEEHFDGVKDISKTAALEEMVGYNKVWDILKHRARLDTDNNLDAVLSGMKQKSTIYDHGFLTDKHMTYYKISDTEYVIYYEKTFFSVKDNLCTVDFNVVKKNTGKQSGYTLLPI